jgi:hypothetical protein
VRPSRAISGIGQLGSDSKAEVAILLASAKLVTKPETAQSGRAGDDVVGCGAVSLPGRVSAHAVPDVAHKSVGRLALSEAI